MHAWSISIPPPVWFDIVDKFRRNAEGALTPVAIDHAVETLLTLETCADITALVQTL